MTCHQVSAKSLSEPMLEYCQLDNAEQNQSIFFIEINTFLFKKIHLKLLSKKKIHFASMY